MRQLSGRVFVPDDEIEIQAIRAQGAGGQNVNKVSTAIHLRFDVRASSLPDAYKEKLLQLDDQRLSKDGVLVIKAQRFRSQEKNRQDALDKLREIISNAVAVRKKRKPTRPTRGSQQRRMDSKTRHGKLKALRRKIDY